MSELKTISAAGGLVLNDANELLMMFRRGKWDLPKGKLDPGETLEVCALREVKEETGLQELILGEKAGVTYHQYFDQWLNEEVIKESHWYHMKAPGIQTLTPQTEEDITELKWVKGDALEACLQNSYENVKQIVRSLELGIRS
jgi:8-oxo-dGTP pyrophosphatase MutT (NUDIX family)